MLARTRVRIAAELLLAGVAHDWMPALTPAGPRPSKWFAFVRNGFSAA